MPKHLVHGRLIGGIVTQVIEADSSAAAAEIFEQADWSPVVTMVTEPPDHQIAGFSTLTVTVKTESADLRPHRSDPTRYKLRFEAWPDFIALINVAQDNLYSLSDMMVHSPDQVASFEARLTLHGLRLLCQQVPDGHVMLETVAREEDYTGERRSPA